MESDLRCDRPRRLPLRTAVQVAIAFLAVATLSACSGQAVPQASATCIQNEQGTGCLPVAPESDRVDLAPPTFSNPTQVDNPLHPSGTVQSAVYLGGVGGEPFRSEVTLLPTTRTIEWDGRSVEVLQSQYFATLDGRILEVAIDWYAQADDGSVWYFGEDVFNYEDGLLADVHGTWLAGRDGPAAMIMPARPQVGDTYRPENIPGLVFEEVTVQETDVTVDGPSGPVEGAIVVRELHLDGSYEDKTFAPGYGEYSTGAEGDLEAMALAVPTDSRAGPAPEGLLSLSADAALLDEGASRGEWDSVRTMLSAMQAAWDGLRAAELPPRLTDQMDGALRSLAEAVDSQRAEEAQWAAIGAARAALDLLLMYRPAVEIDLGRFDLVLRQVELDAAAGDSAALTGDVTSLEWIRDRFVHTLPASVVGELDGLMAEIRAASDAGDLEGAAEVAAHLRQVLAEAAPGQP